jgi:hypothetical protein
VFLSREEIFASASRARADSAIDAGSQQKASQWTLLGGQRHDAILLLDHLAHVADAAGALGLALVGGEDMRGFAGAGVDRRAHVSLPDAVAITDVHESRLF